MPGIRLGPLNLLLVAVLALSSPLSGCSSEGPNSPAPAVKAVKAPSQPKSVQAKPTVLAQAKPQAKPPGTTNPETAKPHMLVYKTPS